MSLIWNQLHDLFDTDDGSLPDIFIESLTGEQVVEVYRRTMIPAKLYGEPKAWNKETQEDIPLHSLDNPAEAVVKGQIESFRHVLEDLKINNVLLPELTVCVDDTAVSFDYRAGDDWGPKEVEQLLAFLWYLVGDMPQARVFHAFEGGSDRPTEIFSRVWKDYTSARAGRQIK